MYNNEESTSYLRPGVQGTEYRAKRDDVSSTSELRIQNNIIENPTSEI